MPHRSPARLRFFAALALAGATGLVALAACTSHSGSSGDADAGADVGTEAAVSCEKDPRVDTYVANLAKKSASGAYDVTLVSSDPAPPVRGNNTWVVKVEKGGAPVSNATLSITAFMPDHGHGSSVKPTITSNGDGTYKIEPLYLFMPGVWKVTVGIAADADAGAEDPAVFMFCVAG